MPDERSSGETPDAARPLALGYAERRSLEERRGRYDAVIGVWVVGEGAVEVPMVRAREASLEDTVTKVEADPSDPARPRRSVESRETLDESVTSVNAENTDPPRPRRHAS